MSKAIVLPYFSSELWIENFTAVILELKSERRVRKDAEKAKADLEA
jgi:hypothetical protein